MKKEMLINVLQPEECRIAIVEDGVLEELYVERTSHESYVGNIYKGRVVNIEPSIQAAFVDFGIGRNGFLHVSDVDPAYYRHLEGGRPPRDDRGRRGRDGGSWGRREDRPRHEPQPQPTAIAREEPRPMPPPPSGEEREFGAGLFDEMTPTPAEELPPEIESIGEPNEIEGDLSNEGSTKPRRRHRGRRRGKPRGTAEQSEAPPDAATAREEGSEGPPPLDSAERRTEEGDPSFEGEFDSGGFEESPPQENDDEPPETDEMPPGEEPMDESEGGDEGRPMDRRRGRDPRRGGV